MVTENMVNKAHGKLTLSLRNKNPFLVYASMNFTKYDSKKLFGKNA